MQTLQGCSQKKKKKERKAEGAATINGKDGNQLDMTLEGAGYKISNSDTITFLYQWASVLLLSLVMPEIQNFNTTEIFESYLSPCYRLFSASKGCRGTQALRNSVMK